MGRADLGKTQGGRKWEISLRLTYLKSGANFGKREAEKSQPVPVTRRSRETSVLAIWQREKTAEPYGGPVEGTTRYSEGL